MPSNSAGVVIGQGLNGLGVIRNLGRSNIDVICLSHTHDYAQKSKYCTELIVDPGMRDNSRHALEVIRSLPERFDYQNFVLFPCSDDMVGILAANRSTLPESLLLNIPGETTLDILIDKWKFYSLLKKLNIPHPRTLNPKNTAELEKDLVDFQFPVFLKPAVSHEFRRRFNGQKGFTVFNRSDLIEKYEMAQQYSIPLMLNEIIPGFSDNHFFIDGYADQNGTIKTLFTRRRIHMFPPKWGNSTSMVSIPAEEIKPAVDDLKRLLEHLKYTGIFSAEVKRDHRDNQFKFIEINARSWWYNLFPSTCGINIIKMAYDDLTGREVAQGSTFDTQKYHVYLWPELKSIYEMKRHDKRPALQLFKEIRVTLNTPIFAADDLYPFLRRSYDYFIRKMRTNE